MTDVSPETVERMIALVRDLASIEQAAITGFGHEPAFLEFKAAASRRHAEARAIAAELPAPVDPDLLQARKAAADYMTANNPDIGETWHAAMMSGQMDDGNMVGIALTAIKRTLATQGDGK